MRDDVYFEQIISLTLIYVDGSYWPSCDVAWLL